MPMAVVRHLALNSNLTRLELTRFLIHYTLLHILIYLVTLKYNMTSEENTKIGRLSISQVNLAEHLKAWEQAQAARLSHMQLQFTKQQLETVQEAVSRILPRAKDALFENPNARGNAVFLLCKFYLERSKPE